MGSIDGPVSGQDRDPDPEGDEFPQRTVYLPDFWIDRSEVTNAAFRECVQLGPCSAYPDRDVNYTDNPAYDNYPAAFVSWDEANKYCQWRNKRLPTEAEWEKAARGADGRLWPWGNALKDNPLEPVQRANVGDANIGERTPVGTFPTGASPYGALDMSGNVWEWVQDWYKFDYYQDRPDPDQSPPGPSQANSTGEKVIRGGSFLTVGVDARTAERNAVFPGPAYDIGFRCAK